MLEFFKSHRFKIIVAITALLFGMMLYSASNDGITSIPKNLLTIVTTPAQKLTAVVSNSVGNFFDQLLNSKNNADENKKLKTQIAALNQKLIKYEELKQENQQLKSIADIKENHTDFQTQMAFVISRDPDDRYSSFIIDSGSLHGIEVNDPVLTQNGLVGIITQVNATSSRVVTILSPDINVGTFENTSKELGIIKGDVKLSNKSLTKLSILSGDTIIKAGDMIVTAGASGLYPKGIPVGTVTEIKSESHGVTKYAVIKPFESIENVDSVVIVTDFLGQGSELLDFINK